MSAFVYGCEFNVILDHRTYNVNLCSWYVPLSIFAIICASIGCYCAGKKSGQNITKQVYRTPPYQSDAPSYRTAIATQQNPTMATQQHPISPQEVTLRLTGEEGHVCVDEKEIKKRQVWIIFVSNYFMTVIQLH